MKILKKIAGAVMMLILVIWELAEFLAIPAILAVIGVVNGFGWQYYAIAMGVYLALYALAEGLGWLLARAMEKWLGKKLERHGPRIVRKLEDIADRFEKKRSER